MRTLWGDVDIVDRTVRLCCASIRCHGIIFTIMSSTAQFGESLIESHFPQWQWHRLEAPHDAVCQARSFARRGSVLHPNSHLTAHALSLRPRHLHYILPSRLAGSS